MEFNQWLVSTWEYFKWVVAAVTLVWGFRKLIKEAIKEINKPFENLEKKMDENHKDLCARISKLESNSEIEEKSIKAILRDNMLRMYRYSTDQGWMSITDKKSFHDMKDNYDALRGENGFMDDICDKVLALPDEPEDEM